MEKNEARANILLLDTTYIHPYQVLQNFLGIMEIVTVSKQDFHTQCRFNSSCKISIIL